MLDFQYDCADEHLNKLMKKCSLEISKIVERIEVIEACVIRLQNDAKNPTKTIPDLKQLKPEKTEPPQKQKQPTKEAKNNNSKALNTFALARELKNFLFKNGVTIKCFAENVLNRNYESIKLLLNHPVCWSSLKSQNKLNYYKIIDKFLKDKKMQTKLIEQAASGKRNQFEYGKSNINFEGKSIVATRNESRLRKRQLKDLLNLIKTQSPSDADVCEQVGISTTNVKWFLQRACMSLRYLKHSERVVVDKLLKWYSEKKSNKSVIYFKPKVNAKVIENASAKEIKNRSLLTTQSLTNFFKLNAFPTARMVHAMANFLKIPEDFVVQWFEYRREFVYKSLRSMNVDQYREFRMFLVDNPNPDKTALSELANKLQLPLKFIYKKVYTHRDSIRQLDKVYFDVLNECNSAQTDDSEVKSEPMDATPIFGVLENGTEVQLSNVVVKTEIDFVEGSQDSDDSVLCLD